MKGATNATPGKRKRGHAQKKVPVTVTCLCCNKVFEKAFLQLGLTPKISCSGLSKHITSQERCFQYYNSNFLNKNNGTFDYFPSLCSRDKQEYRKHMMSKRSNLTNLFQPIDFGLTGTANGPVPVDLPGSRAPNLNTQTIYDANQPQVSRDVIANSVKYDFNSEANAAQDSSLDSRVPYDSSNAPNDVVFEGRNSTNILLHEATIGDNHNSDRVVPDISTYAEMNPLLSSEVELMNICRQLKSPLNGFKLIWEWAMKCQQKNGFDFARLSTCRTRDTVLNEVRKHARVTEKDQFDRKILKWLPSEKAVEVLIRPFKKALFSLLTNKELVVQKNLSLPDSRNPYSYDNHPPVDIISELHHGTWWSRTWATRCEETRKEILVPIILYMDGISLDAHGRQNMMPLNMTLGIFNTATRRRPEAWELIYSHPDQSYMSSLQGTKTLPLDNIRNLHNGLELALDSLKTEMEQENCIVWTRLPWNNRTYEVNMKFAVAFVIGDTELHDKLCCRYGVRQGELVKICRHCDCRTNDLVEPAKQSCTRLWEPRHFSLVDHLGQCRPAEYWKENSHHPVVNSFHRLDFGENPFNIHFATPGECLHMHQLGVAKRSIESFDYFVRNQQKHLKGNREVASNEVSQLATAYGGYLSRQSDRNFPRTRFTSSYLSTAKKEGKDYAGIILTLIITLSSTYGQHVLKDKAMAQKTKIANQIRTLELILFMEEFLKHFQLPKSHLNRLPTMIAYFIEHINRNCQRDGMGTKLVKNHLYFHLPKYIDYWGPPTGWDSSFNESHHKTEIKAPSKNTQQNANTLIEQTLRRQAEKNLLERVVTASAASSALSNHVVVREIVAAGGAKFRIFLKDGEPCMQYDDRNNSKKSVHPKEVLKYCCDRFLNSDVSFLQGFTEHNRECDGCVYKFRAHPSYRSNSGQTSGVWYDWADFLYVTDDDGADGEVNTANAPAQILCFLHLGPENSPFGDLDRGLYAVVRSFDNPVVPLPPSKIIFQGTMATPFYLYSCDSINGTVSVVPDIIEASSGGDNQIDILHATKFFVVKNRQDWLRLFHETMDDVTENVSIE